jgi:hypothetical protein
MGDQINRSSDSGFELDEGWMELPEMNLESTDWFSQVSVLDEDE